MPTNGLTDWDQMSVREQAHALKARLDQLDSRTTGSRRVDRWRAIEEAATEVVDTFDSPLREQAIGRLRRAIEMA